MFPRLTTSISEAPGQELDRAFGPARQILHGQRPLNHVVTLEVGVGFEAVEAEHFGQLVMRELSPSEEVEGDGLFEFSIEVWRLSTQSLLDVGGQLDGYGHIAISISLYSSTVRECFIRWVW